VKKDWSNQPSTQSILYPKNISFRCWVQIGCGASAAPANPKAPDFLWKSRAFDRRSLQ
jgi:hypothetical protein